MGRIDSALLPLAELVCLRTSVGLVLQRFELAIARRAIRKMLVAGIAQRSSAASQFDQRLARWTSDSRRIRIRAAQDLVDVIFDPDIIIARRLPWLCHRLSQCLYSHAVVVRARGDRLGPQVGERCS